MFLDDLKLNVEAAAQLGMHAIKVSEPRLCILNSPIPIPLYLGDVVVYWASDCNLVNDLAVSLSSVSSSSPSFVVVTKH